MNVIVSVAGRFHAFNLAEQLEKHSALAALFTQEFRRRSDRIPSAKIKGSGRLKMLKFLELPLRLLPFFGRYAGRLQVYRKRMHDIFVSRQIGSLKGADVFIGWSGNCLESLKAAKRKDMVTVVESGSTHPLFQSEILKDEYKRVLNRTIKQGKEKKMQIRKAMKEMDICDYITIPSGFVEQSFVKKGISRKKLIRVPYGVDLENFRQVKKKDKVFRVVFCGTICLRKGLHYLLKAFYELNIPDSELLLIGYIDPDMKQFLDKYDRGNVRAIGPRPHSMLYKYYSQGSVFVHPSLEEGLSLVQLEAMACGLPLISTTNTGAEDIMRDGVEGFIVPIRDVKALKSKILYMYNNPKKRMQMSKNAKKRAHVFTWNRYGKCLIKKYAKRLRLKKG